MSGIDSGAEMNDLAPGLVAMLIMGLGIFNLLVMARIAYKVEDEVDEHLSRCSILSRSRLGFGGWEWTGDVQKLGLVAYILMFPKPLLKHGLVDAEQVAAFPKKLKKLIVVPVLLNLIFLLAMCLFRVWMYFYER
jgi:hypothetical protein